VLSDIEKIKWRILHVTKIHHLIFSLSFAKFHWRERKNKIQNFGNVQNFGFSFFSRSPQT